MLNDIEMLQKENAALKLLVSEQNVKLDEAQSKLATYESFISMDEFSKVENALGELAEFVESHGSLNTVSTRLAVLDKYEESASLDEIDEAAELLNEYSKFGSVEELSESLERLDKYEESASLDEIDEAAEIISKLGALGSLEDFEESKAKADALDELGYTIQDVKELSESKKRQEYQLKLNELCESFNVSEESAQRTLEMFGESVEDSKEYLKSLNLQKHKKFTESLDEDKDKKLIGKSIVSLNKIDESRSLPKSKLSRTTLLKQF